MYAHTLYTMPHLLTLVSPAAYTDTCTCTSIYLVEVSQGLLFGHEHLGKLCALLWVQPHHVSQQEHIVGSVANLLGIQDDLLVLASLSKTLNHLHRGCSEKAHKGCGL